MGKDELKKAAQRIVARFLSIGGENEINISQSARYDWVFSKQNNLCTELTIYFREPIMDAMENPSPDIFDGAVKEVYSMMQYVYPPSPSSPFPSSFQWPLSSILALHDLIISTVEPLQPSSSHQNTDSCKEGEGGHTNPSSPPRDWRLRCSPLTSSPSRRPFVLFTKWSVRSPLPGRQYVMIPSSSFLLSLFSPLFWFYWWILMSVLQSVSKTKSDSSGMSINY